MSQCAAGWRVAPNVAASHDTPSVNVRIQNSFLPYRTCRVPENAQNAPSFAHLTHCSVSAAI
jgi:hypothetical protein